MDNTNQWISLFDEVIKNKKNINNLNCPSCKVVGCLQLDKFVLEGKSYFTIRCVNCGAFKTGY